uniref:Ig-like domain-containing protein n=1 Tax=Cyprinus carpio TaxID=7962 RepID=A0A8C2EFJ4_CYPCA
LYFDSNTKKVEGADYWDTQTLLTAGTHHVFRNNIQVVCTHSSCYDGEDFLSLDLMEMRWISPAVWRKQETIYFYPGSSTILTPVSLLQKSSSSPVMCHATGFYPSGVTISWMKNDQEHHEDMEVGELLPNEDGTFQRSSTITVTPEERKKNKFSCVVAHQKLRMDSFDCLFLLTLLHIKHRT